MDTKEEEDGALLNFSVQLLNQNATLTAINMAGEVHSDTSTCISSGTHDLIS